MSKRANKTVAAWDAAWTRALAGVRTALAPVGRRLGGLWQSLLPLRNFLAREKTKRILAGSCLAALVALLLAALSFFLFRDAILRHILQERIRRLERSGEVAIRVGKARFSGLTGVVLESLRLSRNGDPAVSLGRAEVKMDLGGLLRGRPLPRSLALSDLQVDLGSGLPPRVKAAAGRKEAERDAAQAAGNRPPVPADFGAQAARLLDYFFRLVPDRVAIERLTLHSNLDGVHQALYVPRLEYRGPEFATTVEVFDGGRKWACLVSGLVAREKQRLELRLRPERAAFLPFTERQWGLRLGFQSAKMALASRGRAHGTLALEGSLAIGGLALNHRRIAAADVVLPIAALDFRLEVGRDHVELREPTVARLHRLRFRPLLRFEARPERRLRLRVPETRFAAADLFASLPAGLFTSLAGIRTSGELAFHLDFVINLSRPDQVELDIDLAKDGFRIRRFGNANLRRFAEPFLYTAYEQDRPARSFVVGPENPDFVPLAAIPDFLKYAVMISEDGAFFSHNGFLLEPFKNSITANLKAGRFVRGASTISMQLVKNLFLRRHKTIARKLEELLITWLIEENRLVSKERMLETYFNIIEWGPGIYGAREAARYYFTKDVGELTLAEAVFLAAIVPRPKRFAGFFGDDGRLRPWLQSYYASVSRKMLARGWISPFDYDTLIADVTLTGPARLLLKGAEAEPVTPEEVLLGDEERAGE